MSILIDGYNLLHATGIVGRGQGPATLERSRRALLNILASSIDEKQIERTTVVFDASRPLGHLPQVERHKGITVRYAAAHPDADALIEELIASESVPRQLTVVSSDHRLHRAARRRKAKAVDSDIWFARLMRARQRRSQKTQPPPTKPQIPASPEEVEYWLKAFAPENENAGDAREPEQPEDWFPPGYGEDLLPSPEE